MKQQAVNLHPSRWTLNVLIVLLLLAGGLRAQEARDKYQNPLDVVIADPFVLRDKNTYYLYGTTRAHFGFQVFSSTNLIDWRNHGFVLNRTRDSWSKGHFWAPECFEHNGKYYFHYTASGQRTSLRVCLAVGDSPLGPFKELKTPWFDPGQAVIDSHVFKDSDGQLYLYYVLDCSENKLSEIRVCKLSDDLVPGKESSFCVKPSQKWEGTVWNEGPCVFKHGDTYYMTYSANGFADRFYGLGYATAPSPMGPWTKWAKNPVLHRTDLCSGPGHNAIIPSPDGKELFVVYHTLQNPGFNAARQLAVDRIHFAPAEEKSAPDLLVMDGPTADEVLFPSGAAPVVRGGQEEFATAELNRKLWTIFGENPSHYSFQDGRLIIQTADGDVAEKRDDIENIFLQYAPRGDFAVTTRVAFNPAANFQNAFLCIWQDHDNFLKLATVYSDKPKIEVALETQSKYDSHLFDNTFGTDLYLRIERRGDIYTCAVSKDSRTWITMMSGIATKLMDLRIGFGAASPGTKLTTPASFDFIHFSPVE